jgi:methyl-accepting chemotaxis protein
MIMGGASGLALVFACAIAFVLSRSISRRVGTLAQRLHSLSGNCLASLSGGLAAVSTGNLTVDARSTTEPVADVGGDEVGRLSRTFNEMLEQIVGSIGSYNTMRGQLAKIVSEISQSSTVVASASQEMASTSEEAGRAVGEIARAVGDVAAGAERQVQMVTRAQGSTDETRTAAEAAASVAQKGVAAAEQANDAMLTLRASTNEVMAAIRALSAKSNRSAESSRPSPASPPRQTCLR